LYTLKEKNEGEKKRKRKKEISTTVLVGSRGPNRRRRRAVCGEIGPPRLVVLTPVGPRPPMVPNGQGLGDPE